LAYSYFTPHLAPELLFSPGHMQPGWNEPGPTYRGLEDQLQLPAPLGRGYRPKGSPSRPGTQAPHLGKKEAVVCKHHLARTAGASCCKSLYSVGASFTGLHCASFCGARSLRRFPACSGCGASSEPIRRGGEAHAGHKPIRVERFGEIIVGPDLQAMHLLRLLAHVCQDDNRNPRPRAPSASD